MLTQTPGAAGLIAQLEVVRGEHLPPVNCVGRPRHDPPLDELADLGRALGTVGAKLLELEVVRAEVRAVGVGEKRFDHCG